MKRRLSFTTLISLSIVVFCTFCAIFCYLIILDNSPSANLQIPQIALSGPGTNQYLFEERIIKEKQQNVFEKLISGKHNPNKYYPFDSLSINQSNVILHFGKQKRIIFSLGENGLVEDHIKKRTYWLGTDKYGRDVLSRLLVGLRVSLLVGLFAVILSVSIGTIFGLISGYYGGLVDKIVMTVINVNWSIPTLLLAFAILLIMPKGLTAIYLAIGLTLWVDLARIIRGQVQELRNQDFVLSAKTMGVSSSKIMSRHILPNLYGTILVLASINFATAILVEAGLSYLGLGVQPPVPSLGNMLKENYGYATSGYVALSVAPASIILLLVLSFNLLGNGLRDYYDIRR